MRKSSRPFKHSKKAPKCRHKAVITFLSTKQEMNLLMFETITPSPGICQTFENTFAIANSMAAYCHFSTTKNTLKTKLTLIFLRISTCSNRLGYIPSDGLLIFSRCFLRSYFGWNLCNQPVLWHLLTLLSFERHIAKTPNKTLLRQKWRCSVMSETCSGWLHAVVTLQRQNTIWLLSQKSTLTLLSLVHFRSFCLFSLSGPQ